jgi:hypothetical protein
MVRTTYTHLCCGIYFQPSHARLHRLLSQLTCRGNPCRSFGFLYHLVLAVFVCQNYLHCQWLTLRAKPRMSDTAIVRCALQWHRQLHAILAASSFTHTVTSSFKNQTEYAFIFRLCTGQGGGVVGIFHWHNTSACTTALESTQPLTEMGTRNISWSLKAAGA